MIQQTLFISFTEPLTSETVLEALAGIKTTIIRTGLTQAVAVRPHLAVPGEREIPAFIGSAILQVTVTDLESLGELFASTEVTSSFDELRKRHPYETAWVNHEPLSA